MVSLQAPVPLHAPDHPTKKADLPGLAVSVTAVPELKRPLQVEGQEMPAGLLVTVPVEVPASCTVNLYVVEGDGPAANPCAATVVVNKHVTARKTGKRKCRIIIRNLKE
jgi:hypothetical protein